MKPELSTLGACAILILFSCLESPLQADGNPDQGPLPPGHATPWDYIGYKVIPLATYWVEARVMHLQKYSDGRNAQVCPIDFAMGWARMSDPAIYGKLNITQDGRFYRWHWTGMPPIPESEIIVSSANMHLVPATTKVWSDLLTVKEGDLLQLDGYLVEITGPDGWHWTSSLRRDDTGNGACELMWVNSVNIVEHLEHKP